MAKKKKNLKFQLDSITIYFGNEHNYVKIECNKSKRSYKSILKNWGFSLSCSIC